MRILMIFSLAAVVLATATASAQVDCCGKNPPIRPIDRTCLPAGAPRAELPIYMTDLNEKYQEIATIDSYFADNKRMETVVKQARDIQAKGQAVGADAVIRVRPLANKVHGFKENPDTPFFSVKQGSSEDYFVRGTAIKYIVWPKAEPQALPLKAVEQDLAKKAAPTIVDTSKILNFNSDRNRDRREQLIVPQLYGTQQAEGFR